MYLDLMNNLAITTTFLFVLGKIYERRPLNYRGSKRGKLITGLAGGLLGIILMISTIHVTDQVIVDLRHLAILFAAVFGGPLASIFAGLVIGLVRLVWYGVSPASMWAAAVAVVMGFLFAYYIRLNLTKAARYILMNGSYVLVSSIIIYSFVDDKIIGTQTLLNYNAFSLMAGVFTFYIGEFILRSTDEHRSIRYFKLIAENSTDMITTHSLDGHYLYVSPSSEKLLGFEPEELMGQTPMRFVDEADVPLILASLDKVKSTGLESRISYRMMNKQGDFVWVETASKGMRLGIDRKRIEIVCVTRDISAQKQIEEELMLANGRLHELSNLDGLTGIANRRSFDQTLELEWNRAVRSGHVLAMIMFDIDHFKRYNDTYGHQQGDECIKQVAATASSMLRRPADFIARYGGEEFAVILPETDLEGAVQLAEMIRKAIQALALPHVVSSVESVVTISAGAAAIWPSDQGSRMQLVIGADEAMYKAKLKGRNRVNSSG